MSSAVGSPSAAKLAGFKEVLQRLRRSEYRVPPREPEVCALERLLALILQDGSSYSAGEQAVRALKRRFAHWNEVRVARRFEVREALQKSRVGGAERRAELAQEFLRRVFGLQNHLELDWLYDATSERRQKLLNSLMMAAPMVGPVLDLDAHEEEGPLLSTNQRRLLSRLTLVPPNPKDAQVRELLAVEIDTKSLYPKTIALEIHGREVCDSKHPHCRQCALLDICPHGKRVLGPAATKAALQDMGRIKKPKSAAKKSGARKAKTATKAKAARKAKTAKNSSRKS